MFQSPDQLTSRRVPPPAPQTTHLLAQSKVSVGFSLSQENIWQVNLPTPTINNWHFDKSCWCLETPIHVDFSLGVGALGETSRL